MEYNTKLFYRDYSGELRVIDYGDNQNNLAAVNDQGLVTTDIVEIGLGTPISPILCLVVNNK